MSQEVLLEIKQEMAQIRHEIQQEQDFKKEQILQMLE